MATHATPPLTAQVPASADHTVKSAHTGKLAFNADAAAIGIALLLAALVRLNVVPRIGW